MSKDKRPKKINLVNDIPDIARSISHAYGIKREDADGIVKDVLNSIRDTLIENGIVGLKTFGTFKLRVQKGMKYYDFATQAVQTIDHTVVVFHPSTSFKKDANTAKPAAPANPVHTSDNPTKTE